MALSSKPPLLIGETYGLTLNQSVQQLLAELHKETFNSSNFIDTFYKLMQSKINPPIETIWVYSALSFKSREIASEDLSAKILFAKELFQFLSGCSGPCGASKSIALLGPVVFEVYRLVVLLDNDLESKKVRKAIKEIKSLIGAILGYMSVCCCKDFDEENDSDLIIPFSDLVSLWIDGKERFKEFLPLISEGIYKGIILGFPSLNSLAGIVMAEMFLLKLCFDLRVGDHKGVELEKEMRRWSVGSITGLQSFYFFDTLLRLLLEPTLPVTSLLSPEDEMVLRMILYDATVPVEYSFLKFERAMNLPADKIRSLAVKRLIITHEATELFRKIGDQKKAISYTSSFSNSQLPSLIIKCVTSQTGTEEEASKWKAASPKSLINWLLDLDGKGVRIFGNNISESRAKLALGESKLNYDSPANEPEGMKRDVDLQFFIDNQGEEEEEGHDGDNKEMSAEFVAAAHTIGLAENGGRKRKGGRRGGRKKKTKVLKHDDISDDSDSDSKESSGNDGGSSSGSEIDDPTSDEEV